jgi:erythromycin esterase
MSSRQSWVFTPLIFGLLFVTLSFAEGTDPNEDFRVAWLKQHAIPLRSIEPNDEDFSDLEPLLKVLRDVRIVQLGEQSHGDGATFYCKTRLIKFLHQKLGFDVLAFESGLYDCRKAWELLRGGMEPYEAFSHGVYYIWARSEQCRPLIDYWGRAAKSNEPLELCGFDCKFSARTSRDLVVKDVGAVLDKLGPAASNAEQHAAIMKILHKLTNWQRPTMLESQQGDNALAAWRKSLETARPSNSLTESELAFWRQFVASTSILIERESLANQENEEESWMLRDK